MIVSFSARYRYFLYRGITDMRKGFNGLSGLVVNECMMDPLLGDVFIFLSRTRKGMKILHWQGDGFAIYSKRLEKGTFEMIKGMSNQQSIQITADQMHFILSGIILSSLKKRVRYEHANVDKNSVESIASAVY